MARDFATRHNLNPIMWGDYVKQDGSFTKQGMTELIFERANYDPLTEAHLEQVVPFAKQRRVKRYRPVSLFNATISTHWSGRAT